MATILELKEHLEKGGKIRKPYWENGIYLSLDDDGRVLLSDDWEVYEEPEKKKFKVTHTGLYKTRDGRKAFVSCEVKEPTLKAPFYGVVEGSLATRWWTKSGKNLCEPYEDGKEFDIVAEWED